MASPKPWEKAAGLVGSGAGAAGRGGGSAAWCGGAQGPGAQTPHRRPPAASSSLRHRRACHDVCEQPCAAGLRLGHSGAPGEPVRPPAGLGVTGLGVTALLCAEKNQFTEKYLLCNLQKREGGRAGGQEGGRKRGGREGDRHLQ